jgi:putative membrane protein
MSKIQSNKLREKLTTTITNIEERSHVEIVGVIYPQCGKYREASLIWGAIFTFSAFTFFMFSPYIFGDYLFYAGTLLSFFVGYTLATLVKPLQKIFITRERMKANLELKARAIFQKEQLHQTKARIGMMLLIADYEKMVYILPDIGAQSRIPETKLEELKTTLNQAIRSSDVESELPSKLADFETVFEEYIPQVEGDINELPNTINADL